MADLRHSWWSRGLSQANTDMAQCPTHQGCICGEHWRHDGQVTLFSQFVSIESAALTRFLERWTNNLYTSTLHRVISPVSNRDRYSVAFFNEGLLDQVIECIPTCLKPGVKPLHEPIRAEDHLRLRYGMSY